MAVGQLIVIHAVDARTQQLSSFTIQVLSIRNLDGPSNTKAATFQLIDGEFTFHDANNPNSKTQIVPGTLMENGITATFLPQPNITLAYLGGIGIGRDHSFEFVNGEDRTVVAHQVEMIDIGVPPDNFTPPDISNHVTRISEVEAQRQEQKKQEEADSDTRLSQLITEKFGNHPLRAAIQEMISSFSSNGKVFVLSFLLYAKEDGVFERAWQVLQQAWESHFQYEHPSIRGNVDLKASSRAVLSQMMRESGVRWPRPDQERSDDRSEVNTQTITLPDNKDLVNKLRRKLVEYQSRMQKPGYSKSDAQHKVAVLEAVLEKGRVEAEELRTQLRKESWFDETDSERAVYVISDYCTTGGGRVSGGTGLR